MDEGIENLDRFVPLVYRFVAYNLQDHHASQDITQETMLRAWKHRRKLRKLNNLKAWLLRVAANLCIDYIRSRKNIVRSASTIITEPESNIPEPWFGMLQKENCRQLDDVINSLSHRERTVLYLSAFENLTNAEISDVLELSVGSVKVALSRARKSVRHAILKQHTQENQP